MNYVIVRHEGEFAVWGNTVDAPLTFGMSEADIERFVRHVGGEEAVAKLPGKFENARVPGSAEFKTLVDSNRAGEDGRRLSKDELVRYIFIEKISPPPEAGINR